MLESGMRSRTTRFEVALIIVFLVAATARLIYFLTSSVDAAGRLV
jgi:hypothetical protein